MSDEAPLLSICIPTRNRAEHLAATLRSIVEQDGFAEAGMEVVVSDNCSTDGTQALVGEFERLYGDRIRSVRQDTALDMSQSFAAALRAGRGRFLKLNNDTLSWGPGTLATLMDVVRRHVDDRDVLWFDKWGGGTETCRTLDELLARTSFRLTWIGAFGVWREDLDRTAEIFETDWTLLPQVKVLTDLVVSGRSMVPVRIDTFQSAVPKRKGGYNIAEVFGRNYLEILLRHVRAGRLSREAYETEKRELLAHINHYYFDLRNEYAFDKTGYFRWMIPYYWRKRYFYRAWMNIWGEWRELRRKQRQGKPQNQA